MSDENLTVNMTISPFDLIPSMVKFWLYLVFLIPSIICTFFVLYYLLFDRTLRRSLNNHVIIILLFTILLCESTQFPWMLYYYSHGNIWQRTNIFCLIWAFIDWAVYALQLLLFAWTAIERHILIFHDRWVSTKTKRFFVHYLPCMMIILYWFLFYSYVYFYPPCENIFNNAVIMCVVACLFNSFSFRLFDILLNNILPCLIIVIFSVALFLRILRQKYRLRQQIQWRKHRKMTVQLLSISALYLLITTPWAIISFLRICGLPSNIGVSFESYAYFAGYYIAIFFPFVALVSLPELRIKLKKVLYLYRQRSVAPELSIRRNATNN